MPDIDTTLPVKIQCEECGAQSIYPNLQAAGVKLREPAHAGFTNPHYRVIEDDGPLDKQCDKCGGDLIAMIGKRGPSDAR